MNFYSRIDFYIKISDIGLVQPTHKKYRMNDYVKN